MKHFWLFALFSTLCLGTTLPAADWLRFRGPNGSGVAPDATPTPSKWSPTSNLAWKLKLPGPGSSCPIVVGDKVFVTCWSGYGTSRTETDQKLLKRHLVCVNKSTGKIDWDVSEPAELPEDRYGGMFAEHGYASHTPVSDGKAVYVFYGKSGVFAYDLAGKKLWNTKVGSGLDGRNWGSSSSPVLFKDLVIVPACAESQSLVALEKSNGKKKWEAKASGFASTWGTPVIVGEDTDNPQIVIGVPYEIWAFNPENGKLRWYAGGLPTDSYCSSVVSDGTVVYGFEGRSGGAIAIKAGGKGDVSQSGLLWKSSDRNRICTPIVVDKRIYYVSSRTAYCVDAKTGKNIYSERLSGGGTGGRPTAGGRGGQDYGSPVAADGKLYFITRSGDAYVLKLGDDFEQLAVNRVTTDTEDFSATPAIADGKIYIRSSAHLYCVAEKK
ncbi:MAG: PQQ-binding-like beta-propeller repeat protein [Zavarzinella sp.]